MATAAYDSAGESVDLLQTVRHQSSSSAPVQYIPPVVLPTCKLSRPVESARRRASSGLDKQRARLVLEVSDDAHRRSFSGFDDDDDDDDDANVERARTQRCHCCCHRVTQRQTVYRGDDVADVEENRGFQRRRPGLDDDDSDPVSYIQHDHLAASELCLPPLFVTSLAVGSGERSDDAIESGAGPSGSCLSRWCSEMFCRRPRDRLRRSADVDNEDDCWRLFPARHCSRETSRDSSRRRSAAEPSSAAAGDDVRRTALRGDARCRRSAAAKSAVHDRGRCTRVFCLILGAMCIAMLGLLVGALVIANQAALRYSEYH